MTKERIEELRNKYLYVCDRVATKYQIDEDGRQDLALYYLEVWQSKPAAAGNGAPYIYSALCKEAGRILKRKELCEDRSCSITDCTIYDDAISAAEDQIWCEELSGAIESALSQLTTREEEVLRLRFFEGLTGAECGKKFGVTRERIHQIEVTALRKLRHPSRSKFLKPFVTSCASAKKVSNNTPPSYKFVYDLPHLISRECLHAHGVGFEVGIYKNDGYLIWVTSHGNGGGYVNGTTLKLCRLEQATHYKTLDAAKAATALVVTSASVVNSQLLIPSRVTKESCGGMYVCRVCGNDQYVIQCSEYGFIAVGTQYPVKLPKATFFTSVEAAQSVINDIIGD